MICEARNSADGFLIINLMQIKDRFYGHRFRGNYVIVARHRNRSRQSVRKKSQRGNLKPFAGVKISRVTAERVTADTDIDRPGTPSEVFAQDNVTSVEFTWKDTDKGVNGGYVDKTALSHNIYTFENIYGNITKNSLPKAA